jgi:hypothetical protein
MGSHKASFGDSVAPYSTRGNFRSFPSGSQTMHFDPANKIIGKNAP